MGQIHEYENMYMPDKKPYWMPNLSDPELQKRVDAFCIAKVELENYAQQKSISDGQKAMEYLSKLDDIKIPIVLDPKIEKIIDAISIEQAKLLQYLMHELKIKAYFE